MATIGRGSTPPHRPASSQMPTDADWPTASPGAGFVRTTPNVSSIGSGVPSFRTGTVTVFCTSPGPNPRVPPAGEKSRPGWAVPATVANRPVADWPTAPVLTTVRATETASPFTWYVRGANSTWGAEVN